MPPNVDAMVRAGIRAYRGGRKAEARTLLEKAVEIDEHNEQAWLWLSAVVDSPEDQRTCLENVLFINPENDSARQGLQMLTGGQAGSPPPTPQSTPMQAPPPTSGGFGTPLTPAFTEPDTADQPPAWAAPPTATSSSSSIFVPGNEATAEDYDQWLAGLNLGSSAGDDSPQPQAPQIGKPSTFPAVEDILGEGFFDDEEEAESPPVVAPSRPIQGDDLRRQLHGDAFPEDDFASGPFVADMLDIGLDDQQERETSRPAVTSPAPRMSPGAENINLRKSPAPLDDLTQIADGGLFVVDSDEDDYDSIDYDSNLQQDPIGYFQYIPKDISATRLPGTIERYPLPVMAGLIVLIVANVGAVGWLISNLLG